MTAHEPTDINGEIRRFKYFLVVIAVAMVVVFTLNVFMPPDPRPVVCADCVDPYRPYSGVCDSSHNPRTDAGGFLIGGCGPLP